MLVFYAGPRRQHLPALVVRNQEVLRFIMPNKQGLEKQVQFLVSPSTWKRDTAFAVQCILGKWEWETVVVAERKDLRLLLHTGL